MSSTQRARPLHLHVWNHESASHNLDRANLSRLPSASHRASILVLTPPRECPMAWLIQETHLTMISKEEQIHLIQNCLPLMI